MAYHADGGLKKLFAWDINPVHLHGTGVTGWAWGQQVIDDSALVYGAFTTHLETNKRNLEQQETTRGSR